MLSYGAEDNRPSFHEQTVRLIACGDTGPVRTLESIVIRIGSSYILGEIKNVLASADIVFANLECTFSNRGVPLNRVPVFRIKPEAFSVIPDANIKVVSVANNHMFDYGPDAFQDTLGLLKQHDISCFGGGLRKEGASRPLILELNGLKFGFLGFRDCESHWYDHNSVYTEQMDPATMMQRVNLLRPKVDWLVLSLHFGWEYQFYPSPQDVKLCRKLIDEGADIILGHHPHYPQGLERYKDGIISYSLGNFIWDQNFVGHTSSSFLLELELSKTQIISARIVPFKLDRAYRLLLNNSAIGEIDALSNVIINDRKLEEEWYFITRNKLIEFIRNLISVMKRKGLVRRDIQEFYRNTFSPRFISTMNSFFYYMLTGKAFFYEIKKKLKKRVS